MELFQLLVALIILLSASLHGLSTNYIMYFCNHGCNDWFKISTKYQPNIF